jgi:predicted amidohydrolase YtcJ
MYGLAKVQNIHGIGDRANKIIIDAIEAIIGDDLQAKSEPHFRLEHAQIMRVEDIERAAKLGAIGSYQPTHATSDVS